DAVELAAGARLDDTVGVEDDRGARRQLGANLLVRLRRVDPEREAAAREAFDAPVREDEPRQRMARARAGDLAPRVERAVRHRDELADRDLADDDIVRVREEVARLGVLAG